MNNKRKQVSK